MIVPALAPAAAISRRTPAADRNVPCEIVDDAVTCPEPTP